MEDTNEPIPHWTEAPEAIQRKIQLASEDSVLELASGERTSVRAIGDLEAVREAQRHGYLYTVLTPASDELERLIREEPAAAGRFRSLNSLELRYEREAVREAANAPAVIASVKKRAAEEQEAAAVARKQATIDARTAELIADQRMKAEAKARAQAQREAEQEIA
jgi:hypothetical protein